MLSAFKFCFRPHEARFSVCDRLRNQILEFSKTIPKSFSIGTEERDSQLSSISGSAVVFWIAVSPQFRPNCSCRILQIHLTFHACFAHCVSIPPSSPCWGVRFAVWLGHWRSRPRRLLRDRCPKFALVDVRVAGIVLNQSSKMTGVIEQKTQRASRFLHAHVLRIVAANVSAKGRWSLHKMTR